MLRFGLPLVVVLGLLGCMGQEVRPQAEDESERDRYDVKTLGDITSVGNVQPTPVFGVGLVTGLEGTGGEPAKDDYRQMLEHSLRAERIGNVNELLASPECSLVVVMGQITPGSRHGEVFDVQVVVPPGCSTTSLRGGTLRATKLYNYDFAKNLSQRQVFANSARTFIGHHLASAEGPINVLMDDGDGTHGLKQGFINGGAKMIVNSPLALLLNSGQQFGALSKQVADRINETFQGSANCTPANMVAVPQRNLGAFVQVPAQYRLNVPRLLRVVRLIPQFPGGNNNELERRPYRQRLADDLLDPSRTVVAALRLEALGNTSIPILKSGLESKDPLVRFTSAEALAYLGSPAAADELTSAAINHPMLRAFALTALASLDEAVSQVKLQELMESSGEDEVRYGAFRALRSMESRSSEIEGDQLGETCRLHHVAGHSESLVHACSSRRSEIVIFGPEPVLTPPFQLGGTRNCSFVLTATAGDDKCIVSVVRPNGVAERKPCPYQLTPILKTMADMGATYPEVLALLKEMTLKENPKLSCRLRFDALPQGVTVQELADSGKHKDNVLFNEISAKATAELGETPTLFEATPTLRNPFRQGPTPERTSAAPRPQSNEAILPALE
jgi:hypothetical protein